MGFYCHIIIKWVPIATYNFAPDYNFFMENQGIARSNVVFGKSSSAQYAPTATIFRRSLQIIYGQETVIEWESRCKGVHIEAVTKIRRILIIQRPIRPQTIPHQQPQTTVHICRQRDDARCPVQLVHDMPKLPNFTSHRCRRCRGRVHGICSLEDPEGQTETQRIYGVCDTPRTNNQNSSAPGKKRPVELVDSDSNETSVKARPGWFWSESVLRPVHFSWGSLNCDRLCNYLYSVGYQPYQPCVWIIGVDN